MAKKTYYMEKLGIRVDGCATVVAARKAWESLRDYWCDVSTACPPYVLAYRGFTLIVCPKTYRDHWEYTVVTPEHSGIRHASCYFGANSQMKAVAVGLGALAQAMWTREIADEAEFFSDLCIAARVTAHEAQCEYHNFLHVTAFWRQHPIAEAA